MNALALRRKTPERIKDNRKFMLHPASYVNGRRSEVVRMGVISNWSRVANG